ncbi:MAG TPA: 2-dehydropantoate 2-reductase, partial [Pyrinomonadaceae bacterium]|nr:2-dehydropantoate 2-reductase [Pyrinomonadaceae bacterium]
GGYFGGRLALAGTDVTFIARGEHLRALRSTGLRVDGIKGDFTISPVRVTDDPAQVSNVDVVILGVKAWQIGEAAHGIRSMIGPSTFVLPLQNGVEAFDELSAVLGKKHVLGGLCKIVSYLVEPGHIRHAGFEPFVAFGEWDNHSSDRVEALRETFARAGVQAKVPPDIQAAVWNKFLFISGFSGVGAVTRAPAGVLRSLPQTRSLMERSMLEIAQVAEARGIRLPSDAVNQALASLDSLPEKAMSSMQRDIMAHRPSELESQNGAVVRLGREAGIETPVNTFIYDSLLPREKQARGELQFPA